MKEWMQFFRAKQEPQGRVITFEDELKAIWSPPKPTEDEKSDMRTIVSSEQYESLRTFLSRYAIGFYVAARSYADHRTHRLNEMGKEMENIIATLDSYREKPDNNTDSDPYDV